MSDASPHGTAAPTPPAKPSSAPDSDTLVPLHWHLLDYLRVLSKRRWTALPVFLIITGYAGYVVATAVPEYGARVQLLIEADNPNVLNFKEVIEHERATTEYYETQYTILRSRALAQKTIEKLQLWEHPQFVGSAAQSFNLERAVRGWVAHAVAFVQGLSESRREHGPEEPDAAESAAHSKVIDAFLSALTVTPVRNSQLVDITFRSANPRLAAAVANALAEAYIEQNLEFRFLASKEATDWLGQKLTEQAKQVEAGENELQRYREQTDAVSLDDRNNIVAQKLADLNAAVTRAKTERISKQTLYNQLQAIATDREALDTFPAIQSNGFIQQLKSQLADLERQHAQQSERLGERHPEIVKLRSAMRSAEDKLQGEIAKVVQAIHNEYLVAQKQEQSLVEALDAQKREALTQNRMAIKYEALERVATSNRQIFESLLQRAKETGITGELKVSNVRVVDTADVPTTPTGPRRFRILLFAVFFGAALGIGLAFFVEYLDDRIKSPEEIKAWGLPCLAIVPASTKGGVFEKPFWRRKQPEGAMPLINNGGPAHFAESFRGMRTQVLVSELQKSRGGTLVVTSTAPHEGKTCVATNLAIALAQASREVLLIDADMRQPRIHELFKRPLAPGLSNMMTNQGQPQSMIAQSNIPSLWLLTAGERPPNPAELLASRRFEQLLAKAAERFDWVVIDTPPVMAVTDACIVSHVSSAVLFVVAAEMTKRHTAVTALEQLEAVNAQFVGAVLNRVKLDRNRYFYSHYYHRDYGAYYQSA